MPANPAEWRDVLIGELDARWAKLRVFDAYYEGDQQLSYMTRKFRDIYGSLFSHLADNWCQIVVDASVERLRVQGFRFGENQEADDDAWRIWQANGLDGESNMAMTESVKLSEAYWLVEPAGEIPRITAEHPSQVIVALEPGDRRTRAAALKKWADGDWTYANVYLRDRVVKYRAKLSPGVFKDRLKWVLLDEVAHRLDAVPVVPIPNNPSMIHGGRSDLAGGVLSIQDAINKLLCDLLVGSEYQSFPQRVLLGVEQPRDASGNPVPMNKVDKVASESRLWMFPGADAKAFEFSAAELSNIRDAIDGLVRDLTAQTRTPPHYVSGTIINASGDALKAAETGLVAKVRDKMDPFGEAHEEMMRLAFKSIDAGDERANATDAETIWRDPESRSQAEVTDSVQKQSAMGLPFEVALEKMGYSPQEIDRILALKEADDLIAETLALGPQPLEAETQNGTQPAFTSAD